MLFINMVPSILELAAPLTQGVRVVFKTNSAESCYEYLMSYLIGGYVAESNRRLLTSISYPRVHNFRKLQPQRKPNNPTHGARFKVRAHHLHRSNSHAMNIIHKQTCNNADKPNLKDFSFWKGVIAEFVAMVLFVYVGVGTAVYVTWNMPDGIIPKWVLYYRSMMLNTSENNK